MCEFEKIVDFVLDSVYDNENTLDGGEDMEAKEVLRAAYLATGICQNDSAERIGYSKQQLSGKIVRGTLRADEFLKILDVIGVDVEFKLRENGQVIKTQPKTYIPGIGDRVRRMVDKVIYDTARADALANNFYADGVNKYTEGKAMELYIDSDGRYFFAEYCEWDGVKERITPVNPTVAAAFIEKYGTELEKPLLQKKNDT